MIGGGVVAALLVALLLVWQLGGDDGGGGSSADVPAAASPTATAEATTQSGQRERAIPRGDVTVAVVNGTTLSGLAADISEDLIAAGFNKGAVATGADQTQQTTVVMYASGFQAPARTVAKLLKLSASRIRPLDQDFAALAQADATSAPAPEVVVVIGADKTP